MDKPMTDKEHILRAIDSAKLSVLRGMHSGDKVANILVSLVEEIHAVSCARIDGKLPPVEAVMVSEPFKEADAYVLRINEIRNSKKKKGS